MYDLLATHAETETTRQNSTTPTTEFVAWAEKLLYPPNRNLNDRAACERAIWLAYGRHFAEASAKHAAGVTAVPDDEQAPAGWDNATLLAEMERSWRLGG